MPREPETTKEIVTHEAIMAAITEANRRATSGEQTATTSGVLREWGYHV